MDNNRIFKGISALDGFYDLERDIQGSFVGTRKKFTLKLQRPGSRFLTFNICYSGDDGDLLIKSGRETIKKIKLRNGWNMYICDLSPREKSILEFEVNKLVPVKNDSREMGLMVRKIEAMSERERFESQNSFIVNKALNEQEFLSGKTVLQSFPTHLRIDIEARCNIKPPCVYCEWDWAKSAEKSLGANFDARTLKDFGSFYHYAEEIVDCSHGEPLLNKNLKKIIDEFESAGKHFEMTTNGLLLDGDRLSLFLGKNMTLYASLDASNPETYARLRIDSFSQLVKNLKSLCERKKEYDDLPVFIVSFIVMKSNIREFPDFLDLMRYIGVDGVKLRSLFEEGYVKGSFTRRGFRFDYRNEILSLEELSAFSEYARGLAQQKGCKLIVELDFGEGEPGRNRPLCAEPWETIYVLRRGIMGCCFAKEPVARANKNSEGLDEFLREVFNNEKYQEIRSSLARGELPGYCLNSPSCPIVKKAKNNRQETAG